MAFADLRRANTNAQIHQYTITHTSTARYTVWPVLLWGAHPCREGLSYHRLPPRSSPSSLRTSGTAVPAMRIVQNCVLVVLFCRVELDVQPESRQPVQKQISPWDLSSEKFLQGFGVGRWVLVGKRASTDSRECGVCRGFMSHVCVIRLQNC